MAGTAEAAVGTVQDPADIELLRSYEPIVRYNHAELFFPTAVDGYLNRMRSPDGHALSAISRWWCPPGEVTPEVLGNYVAEPGKSLYLRLVQKPLNGIELARWQVTGDRPRFHAPGRLVARRALRPARSTRASTPRSCCAARSPAARPPRRRSSTPRLARRTDVTSTTAA